MIKEKRNFIQCVAALRWSLPARADVRALSQTLRHVYGAALPLLCCALPCVYARPLHPAVVHGALCCAGHEWVISSAGVERRVGLTLRRTQTVASRRPWTRWQSTRRRRRRVCRRRLRAGMGGARFGARCVGALAASGLSTATMLTAQPLQPPARNARTHDGSHPGPESPLAASNTFHESLPPLAARAVSRGRLVARRPALKARQHQPAPVVRPRKQARRVPHARRRSNQHG